MEHWRYPIPATTIAPMKPQSTDTVPSYCIIIITFSRVVTGLLVEFHFFDSYSHRETATLMSKHNCIFFAAKSHVSFLPSHNPRCYRLAETLVHQLIRKCTRGCDSIATGEPVYFVLHLSWETLLPEHSTRLSKTFETRNVLLLRKWMWI